jgi:DNA-binding LacI/PurR family transcriptional regulator
MTDRPRAPPKGLAFAGPSPTIGLLVDSLEDSYQWSVLRGAMDAARDLGAHLLCFAGGVLEAPLSDGGGRNGVFDLAGPSSVDALVVMSGAIGNRIGPERLARYCERYRPLPICSIAVQLGEMSSVCIDNESGIRVVIEHLVRVHGTRRIAFVRGPVANAEAERRFAVYKQALDSNGISFSPELVAVGDFEQRGGREAVATLLERRKGPHGDLDAIVAANDAMALGVIDELSRLGIRVPDQVAVVGFDDIEESRFAMPPLTTVRQPLYEQGRDAVRIVLDQIRNSGAAPVHTVRHTELVMRRSCGCLGAHAASSRELDPPVAKSGFESALVERHQIILANMSRASRGELGAAGAGWAERLLNAFVEQIRGDVPDAFTRSYDDFVRKLSTSDADLGVCNDVLSTLRNGVVPCLASDPQRRSAAEDMFHEARLMTADVMERIQAWRRMRAERRARSLGRAAAAISAAHDLDDLSRAVTEHLPALGIARCYLLTFDSSVGAARLARLALVHTPDATRADTPSWQLQPAVEILRHHLLPSTGVRALAVLPTVLEDDELGILVLELEAVEGYMYETLRDVFTTALAGARQTT